MLKINPDFENLIPPLSEDEFNGLEKSILEEGVREPIVTWRGFIVDGHNRYKIATKYGLDFDTVEYDFADEAAVKLWMIRNQLSRSNLQAGQIAMLGVLEESLIHPIEMAARKREYAGKANPGEPVPQGRTREILASSLGVSDKTVQQALKVRDSGEISHGETVQWVDIFNTDKKYRVVYADPPWKYNDKLDISASGGAEKHYHTMELSDICAAKPPTENNAILFLWVTSPFLRDSFEVIDAWGFKYKTSFVWDKVAHGMGHYNSVRHELLLVCTKGSCTPDVQKRYDSVVTIERTEHSRKPAYFRELIDELYPIGERIELFAREAADGWDVWGDMA